MCAHRASSYSAPKERVDRVSRQDSSTAFVELVLALLFAVVLALLLHYFSRGRDWFWYVQDNPDLYALTEGEHRWFVASAWAFSSMRP